jgi:AcrR family transcriptional regulator
VAPAAPIGLTLADVVERSGVPASTVHHYRRLGLLPPPERIASNRFVYDERHVAALLRIRRLRDERHLNLVQIAEELEKGLPGGAGTGDAAPDGWDARERVVDAAVELFFAHPFAEVTIHDVAQAAGMAKGSVYRYFASKEELFSAVVERLVHDSAAGFAEAVDALGGAAGLAHDPEAAAVVFARLVAQAMPILLELGARAAKGHEPSGDTAREVLRTLAEAAGRPLSDDPVPAGLEVIEKGFSLVLRWAVAPEWPDDTLFGPPAN